MAPRIPREVPGVRKYANLWFPPRRATRSDNFGRAMQTKSEVRGPLCCCWAFGGRGQLALPAWLSTVRKGTRTKVGCARPLQQTSSIFRSQLVDNSELHGFLQSSAPRAIRPQSDDRLFCEGSSVAAEKISLHLV